MTRAGFVLVLLLGWAAPVSAQVEAPTVATDTIRSLAGPVVFRFSKDVRSATESNVTVAPVGAGRLDGRIVCTSSAGAAVSCANGPVHVAMFYPPSPFILGQVYEVKVNPDGVTPQVTDGVSAVPAYRRFLGAPTSAQENAPGMRYRWRRVAAGAAGDDVYVSERRVGARAIYRFTGTSVIWITVLGPDQGIATVWIDGRRVATVDTGASSLRYRAGKVFGGLADRAHTLVVRVEGRDGRGRNAWVAVDGFRTPTGGTVNESRASFTWPVIGDGSASGDAYASTPTPAAFADITFRGRGIDWITHLGPDQGQAKVYIDGVHVRTFDNYASTVRYGVRRTITNLSDARHRLWIVVAGTRNRASRGTAIRIDAVVLRAATVDFRRLGAWVDLYDYSDATDPSAALDEMDEHGVRTLYLQTGRQSTAAFAHPTGVGRWLEGAHARGLKVIGWYLPRYDEPITNEVTKTAVIATYRSPAGHRFDGLAIDIEYRTDPDTGAHLSRSAFFDGITKHLRLVRGRVGVSYPIGAITFAPLDMDIWPGGWDGFPWSAVARYADVAMPMSYWSNRYARCEGAGSYDPDPRYCVRNYTEENVRRTRSLTGLPVHVIGGVMNNATTAHVQEFTAGARAQRAYGGSLYDASTTADAEWDAVEAINTF